MCKICDTTGTNPHAADPRDRTGCPFTTDGLHQWAPDPDDPDLGDVCVCCGTGR